jgi:hypothetical protein
MNKSHRHICAPSGLAALIAAALVAGTGFAQGNFSLVKKSGTTSSNSSTTSTTQATTPTLPDNQGTANKPAEPGKPADAGSQRKLRFRQQVSGTLAGANNALTLDLSSIPQGKQLVIDLITFRMISPSGQKLLPFVVVGSDVIIEIVPREVLTAKGPSVYVATQRLEEVEVAAGALLKVGADLVVTDQNPSETLGEVKVRATVIGHLEDIPAATGN